LLFPFSCGLLRSRAEVSTKQANAVEEISKASRVLKGASLRSQPHPRSVTHDGLAPTAKVNARSPIVSPVA
jgi:hypothetical protein